MASLCDWAAHSGVMGQGMNTHERLSKVTSIRMVDRFSWVNRTGANQRSQADMNDGRTFERGAAPLLQLPRYIPWCKIEGFL